MTRKEEELFRDAVSVAKLQEDPKPWDGSSYWSKAIVEVLKKNGSKGFAIATYNAMKAIGCDIHYVNGDSSIIHSVTNVYPFLLLENKYVPFVKTKEDIIRYIASNSTKSVEELKDVDKDSLRGMMLTICVHNHIKAIKNEELMKEERKKQKEKENMEYDSTEPKSEEDEDVVDGSEENLNE